MSARGRFGRIWERVLSLGSYQEEPETQQGKRRIIVGVSVVFVMFNLMAGFGELGAGRGWLAVTAWLTVAANVTAMTFLHFKPRWFAGVLNALFAFLSVVALVETVLLGGLLQSSAQMLWSRSSDCRWKRSRCRTKYAIVAKTKTVTPLMLIASSAAVASTG